MVPERDGVTPTRSSDQTKVSSRKLPRRDTAETAECGTKKSSGGQGRTKVSVRRIFIRKALRAVKNAYDKQPMGQTNEELLPGGSPSGPFRRAPWNVSKAPSMGKIG